MIKRVLLFLCLGLEGCGSIPTVPLPFVLDKPSTKASVVLDSDAQIVLGQPIKRGQSCDKVKAKLSGSVTNVKKDEKVELKLSCTEVKGAVVLISSVLSKGTYLVAVQGGEEPIFSDTPSIVLRYPDPDFKSGADQELEGAKELVANQTIKGVENYSSGVSTQWVHLKGKKGTLSLTFFEEGDGRWLNAEVYAQAGDGKKPRLLGILLPKRKRDFKINEDNLFVKVTAREFGAERKYSLLRFDGKAGTGPNGKGGTRVSVAVIDCYPVGDSSAVVLLKASSAVKLNEEISIFGKKSDGASVSLGKCTVTGISQGQASCRLEEASLSNIVEYRAEVVSTGGEST
jgi:hypothetical protein